MTVLRILPPVRNRVPRTASVFPLALVLVAALLLPGCASSRNSSEREWERGQCAQVVDKEAHEKCLERVDSQYGKR
jgi:hypothetical protein